MYLCVNDNVDIAPWFNWPQPRRPFRDDSRFWQALDSKRLKSCVAISDHDRWSFIRSHVSTHTGAITSKVAIRDRTTQWKRGKEEYRFRLRWTFDRFGISPLFAMRTIASEFHSKIAKSVRCKRQKVCGLESALFQTEPKDWGEGGGG